MDDADLRDPLDGDLHDDVLPEDDELDLELSPEKKKKDLIDDEETESLEDLEEDELDEDEDSFDDVDEI